MVRQPKASKPGSQGAAADKTLPAEVTDGQIEVAMLEASTYHTS
jgi:hypothetical protein